MATSTWVNIGSDNGLSPDGAKPLPEPMSNNHRWGFAKSHENNCAEMLNVPFLGMSLKVVDLKLQQLFSGARELMQIQSDFKFLCVRISKAETFSRWKHSNIILALLFRTTRLYCWEWYSFWAQLWYTDLVIAKWCCYYWYWARISDPTSPVISH